MGQRDELKKILEEIHILAEESILYLPIMESLDHEEKEPLIKDEKIRKAIMYIFPKYALIHIEKQGGKRIFEFGGTRLEIDAPNENAIEHGLSYCIAELCGEEE